MLCMYEQSCLTKYIVCIRWKTYRVKSDFLESIVFILSTEVALGECLRMLGSEEECTQAKL